MINSPVCRFGPSVRPLEHKTGARTPAIAGLNLLLHYYIRERSHGPVFLHTAALSSHLQTGQANRSTRSLVFISTGTSYRLEGDQL